MRPIVPLLISLAAAGPLSGATPAATPPNVLFIAIDDLRPELGAYGVARAKTPHMDALAAGGLLFERAYTQQAVCAPSRISLMTGLRPDSTGIYDLKTRVADKLPDWRTMPQAFRGAGYETVSVGKIYHHHYAKNFDDPDGWSIQPITEKGLWWGRGYMLPESRATAEKLLSEEQLKSGLGPAWESADVPDEAYPDGANTVRAIAELERLKAAGKPFFLAFGLVKPHLPFNAPRRYWDLYDAAALELPPRTPPEGASRFALANSGELRQYAGMPKGTAPFTEEQARSLLHGYLASTSYADAMVGRVLAALKDLGLAENTIVVLWGDHGWKLGDYGEWCKHTNMELDTRIPLIIRAPGVTTPGSRTRALVETVDIFPTLCELTGVPPTPGAQGASLLPLLRDPAAPWHEAAYMQYPRGGDIMGHAVKTDHFRYVQWKHTKSGQIEAEDFFDHRTDPGETRNLAKDTAFAEDLKHHQQLVEEWPKPLVQP